MPINNLLRQLLNDEKVVQKLADSKPIRDAAKATVAAWHKGKVQVQDALEKLKNLEYLKEGEERSLSARETTYEQWRKRTVDDALEKKEKKMN